MPDRKFRLDYTDDILHARLMNFADYCSMHGLPDVKRTLKTKKWMYFYVIVTVGFTVMCIVNVVYVFSDFFKMPTTTLVRLMHETDATFPAVTICNLNVIRNSKLTGKLKELNDHNFNDSVNWYHDWQTLLKESADFSNTAYLNDDFRSYAYDTMENLTETGHQLNDMLCDCEFRKVQCFPQNFTQWVSPQYGNCYTFIMNETTGHAFIGPGFGLKLTLFTEDHEYLNTQDTVGFRISVHPATLIPFPEDDGHTISPGQLSSMGVKFVSMIRQPLPYDSTDCGNDAAADPIHAKTNLYSTWDELRKRGIINKVNYSQKACEKTCTIQMVYDLCHCVDATMITWEQALKNLTTPGQVYRSKILDKHIPMPHTCYMENDGKCMNKVMSLVNTGVCNPICPASCHEEVYMIETTASLWPREQTFETKIEGWTNRVPKIASLDTIDKVRSNVAYVEIYLQQLNYEAIIEEVKYNFWSFMSSLGGTLGLWTGLSVLSFMQIFELLVKVCRSLYKQNPDYDVMSDNSSETGTKITTADTKERPITNESQRLETADKNRHSTDEGRAEGRDKGRDKGRDEGRGKGRDEGRDEGRNKSLQSVSTAKSDKKPRYSTDKYDDNGRRIKDHRKNNDFTRNKSDDYKRPPSDLYVEDLETYDHYDAKRRKERKY